MESLREFIAQNAQMLQEQDSRAIQTRDEWVAALTRLNARIQEWLEEADPDRKVLEIQAQPYTLREEGIGAYEAPGLVIHLGRRMVRVVPIARHVAGPLSTTDRVHVIRAYGRVDLTDGLRKFMLFRVGKPEEWSLIGEEGLSLTPLKKESFEAALMSLLR